MIVRTVSEGYNTSAVCDGGGESPLPGDGDCDVVIIKLGVWYTTPWSAFGRQGLGGLEGYVSHALPPVNGKILFEPKPLHTWGPNGLLDV